MNALLPSSETTSLLLTSGVWTAVALVLVALIRGWPQLKKIQAEADGDIQAKLLGRITQLETQLNAMELHIEAERQRHAKEIQIIRHRLNNETASLDALLLLLEVAPDKLTDNIALIKQMRESRANALALEQGAALAAGLTGETT